MTQHMLLCRFLIVSRTSFASTVLSLSFFLLSVQNIFNMRRQIHILNALSFLMSFFSSVHFLFLYNAILLINAFFQLEAERSTYEIFFLLKASFANAVRRYTSSSFVTSSFFIIEYCSQLSAFPPRHPLIKYKFTLAHKQSAVAKTYNAFASCDKSCSFRIRSIIVFNDIITQRAYEENGK